MRWTLLAKASHVVSRATIAFMIIAAIVLTSTIVDIVLSRSIRDEQHQLSTQESKLDVQQSKLDTQDKALVAQNKAIEAAQKQITDAQEQIKIDQNRIDVLLGETQGNISSNTTGISQAKGFIGQLQNEIDSLVRLVTSMEAEIAALQARPSVPGPPGPRGPQGPPGLSFNSSVTPKPCNGNHCN